MICAKLLAFFLAHNKDSNLGACLLFLPHMTEHTEDHRYLGGLILRPPGILDSEHWGYHTDAWLCPNHTSFKES